MGLSLPSSHGDDETVAAGSESDFDHIQYDISVMDTAGQDHSEKFLVLGSSLNHSGHNLERRFLPRPLNFCPAGICDQICVRGIPKPNLPLPDGQLVPPTLTAYCVATEHFIRIGVNRASHKTSPGTIATPYKAQEGKMMAMEAVLTGLKPTKSIFASSLRMSAQTSDTSNNVQTWRSQAGGTAVCTNCARILIAPVPVRTQRIVMNVVLDAAAAGGLLFLSQIQI
ncbi:MAG: hypothetical protein Q9204_006860 [Flavoplaca sp. TL-2023a]